METRETPSAHSLSKLCESVDGVLARADAVVLSDYAKGVLTQETCRHIIDAARSRSIPVLVDPKTADFRRYSGATTISPNAHELAVAVRGDRHDLEGLFKEAEASLGEWEIEYLTVTLGDKGIALLRPDGRVIAPAVAKQVFDVSGAGDTVLSVLALSAAANLSPETAIRVANVAAGIVVSKVGTVPIQKWELVAALAPSNTDLDTKLVGVSQLLKRLAEWRAAGETVAFTNGCFDLLHVGHITLLEHARQAADHLVVGLNSDASVRRLKGSSRPVVHQPERARVLGALSAVDSIVIFDEDTPLRLVEAIRPDVLVKGGDYTEATIVGADQVRSWGGQVKIVPTVPGHSTSQILEKSVQKGS
jgi:D-beta-D-heptose 7-phosphate kinase/D-beta-D-heptose 1-phosphate adenosyltransferase